MSLYRDYRPQTFADVIGQDHIITTLENAVKHDKLAHAYLFAGSRGTGKTSVARILAKMIMTRGIEDEALRKQIIKGIEEGNLVDLLEIDGASNRGIDDVRDLIEKIQFSPVVATAKVYIIDEVHMLTKEAFNALLKTLEEPPEYAFFILATTELSKIPITIQSRCQSFPFRLIRDEDIIRRLQYVADSEKIEIDRDALRTIAHHVDGSMRDALSLLDQLRSLPSIRIDDVRQRVGATGHEYIEEVLAALDGHDEKAITDIVHRMEADGIPMDVFLGQLLGSLREVLHAAINDGQSFVHITGMIDELLQALRHVRSAPLPALVLESALLSLCRTENGNDVPAPVKVEKKTEKKKEAVATVTEDEKTEDAKEENEPVSEEKKKPESIIEATELTLGNLQSSWTDMLKEINPASVRMSLKNGQIEKVDGTTIHLSFSSAFHRDKVADTEASRAIESVIERFFRQSVKVQCHIDNHGSSVDSSDDEVNIAEAAAEIF